MEYTICRRKSRRIVIKIDSQGKLTVFAPSNASDKFVAEFVESKDKWIQKHAARINAMNEKATRYNIETADKILCFGKEYSFIYGEVGEPTPHGEYLILPQKFIKNRSAYMRKWYKSLASELVGARLEILSAKLGLNVSKWRLTSARGKWGSCGGDNSILLSWRLAMLPQALVDYVLVHELCHIAEHNHSPAFWQKVASILPNYKESKKALKEYGFVMQIV